MKIEEWRIDIVFTCLMARAGLDGKYLNHKNKIGRII